jgi:hypothetical protein
VSPRDLSKGKLPGVLVRVFCPSCSAQVAQASLLDHTMKTSDEIVYRTITWWDKGDVATVLTDLPGWVQARLAGATKVRTPGGDDLEVGDAIIRFPCHACAADLLVEGTDFKRLAQMARTTRKHRKLVARAG